MSDPIPDDFAKLSVSDVIDLSLVLRQHGEVDAAILAQMRAINLEPQNPRAHVALAESLLLRDDYRAGFLEHQWRLHLEAPGTMPAFTAVPWSGYAIPSPPGSTAPCRLLVVADQGFGDNLMFSRYLPWAHDRCCAMTVVVPPELARLLTDARWDVCSEWRDIPPHVAQVRMSSLPMLAGTTAETIPKPPTWSVLAQSPVVETPDCPLPLVGFCWHGKEGHPDQKARSVPFSQMRRLITHPGLMPICLQRDASAVERASFPPDQATLDDWADTAGLIASLDLVITSDTAVAHLAGTLSIATYVLLKHDSDWRYGLNRDWNPWYPSQMLFRQRIPGDWSHAIAEVETALASLLAC